MIRGTALVVVAVLLSIRAAAGVEAASGLAGPAERAHDVGVGER